MAFVTRRAMLSSTAVALVMTGLPAGAQTSRDTEWRNYAADLANTRYAVTASFNPFVPAVDQERFAPGLPRTFFLGAQYRWSR